MSRSAALPSRCSVKGAVRADLVAECKNCCVPDAVERQFDTAKLHYDRDYFEATCAPLACRSSHLTRLSTQKRRSEIGQFVSQHAAAFPALKVHHKARSMPRLTLKDKEGSESVDVYGWKREDVYDYLRTKLGLKG